MTIEYLLDCEAAGQLLPPLPRHFIQVGACVGFKFVQCIFSNSGSSRYGWSHSSGHWADQIVHTDAPVPAALAFFRPLATLLTAPRSGVPFLFFFPLAEGEASGRGVGPGGGG